MKQRKPRKSKKSIAKNGVLIYDIALLPKNKTVGHIYNEFKNYGMVIYNSQAAGNIGAVTSNNIPFVINNVRNIKFIDLSQKSDEKTGG